jgi:hypothetical protein
MGLGQRCPELSLDAACTVVKQMASGPLPVGRMWWIARYHWARVVVVHMAALIAPLSHVEKSIGTVPFGMQCFVYKVHLPGGTT